MRVKKFLSIALFFLISQLSYADIPFSQRTDVNQFINMMHQKHQFSKENLTDTLNAVSLQEKIIDSMNRPYEKKPWSSYHQLFMTNKRINEGMSFWQDNKETLEEAEKKFGVPAEIIVAVLGVETYYGRIQGQYRVIDALSTLAFNYPNRAKFFKKELREFLILCRELNISPLSVNGSYAGAIGMPQFMPSSYRAYSVAFKGQGPSDLRNDNKDAIFSVANYLKRHGWQKTSPIAKPAVIKGQSYKKLKANSKKPNYSLHKLAKYGIKPENPVSAKKAGLVILEDKDKEEIWLGFNNFFVITRYNTSKQYAAVVHLLAKALKEKRAQTHV